MRIQKRVEQEYGKPFWEVIKQLADDGNSRADVCRIIGYRPNGFSQLLKTNPDKNPFESVNIPANYFRQTGETLVAGVRRMRASGMSLDACAIAVGYSGDFALKRAMKARGVVL